MNIDFIKVPFSNNPSMQKYDGPLFNPNPEEKYISEKHLQIKKYGKDGTSSGQVLGDILGKVFKSKKKDKKEK